MSVMTKRQQRPTSLPGRQETREEIESLWELYLIWRSGDAQPAERACLPASGFFLLREIETRALDVLKPYLSERIPCEFVVALMNSTADTTSRFMLANPDYADCYRMLGFEIFWSGLAYGGDFRKRKGITGPGEHVGSA